MKWKQGYTAKEKINGELAMQNLSREAYDFYCGTSPLDVYEMEEDNGEKRYDVVGINNADWLTFDELDELFCDLRASELEAMKEWED